MKTGRDSASDENQCRMYFHYTYEASIKLLISLLK